LASLAEPLAELVRDRSQPRVQLFASLAFRQLTHPRPKELLEELSANADRDPALRHGLVMALSGQQLAELVGKGSDELDLAAARGLVVALRKHRSSLLKQFLVSSEVRVAEEAARAVYDLPLSECLPDLASAWGTHPQSEVFTRRALNAAYRLGGESEARSVAAASVDSRLAESLRREAVDLLAGWANPSPRDRILGMWRPLEPRDAAPASKAFGEVVERLLTGTTGELRVAAVQAAGRLKVEAANARLLELAGTEVLPGSLRAACVKALGELAPAGIAERLIAWTRDAQPAVRTAAMEVLVAQQPDRALQVVDEATRSSDLRERQAAWKQLGLLRLARVPELLRSGLEQLDEGEVVADTRLDLVEAARSRSNDDPALGKWLAAYDAAGAEDPAQKYRDSLVGGDAQRGRVIFKEWANVSCLRCHRVGEDGGYVGPNLSDIGSRKDRQYLLESLVDPNRAIAEKYETTVVLDLDGKTHSGIVNFEDEKTLRLLTAEGEMVTIDKEQIEERTTGKSAMPADLIKHLSPFDVRDLVEFLAQQKATPGGPAVESLERTDR
jgi:quinoprotein glucose dehydrogenase